MRIFAAVTKPLSLSANSCFCATKEFLINSGRSAGIRQVEIQTGGFAKQGKAANVARTQEIPITAGQIALTAKTSLVPWQQNFRLQSVRFCNHVIM